MGLESDFGSAGCKSLRSAAPRFHNTSKHVHSWLEVWNLHKTIAQKSVEEEEKMNVFLCVWKLHKTTPSTDKMLELLPSIDKMLELLQEGELNWGLWKLKSCNRIQVAVTTI